MAPAGSGQSVILGTNLGFEIVGVSPAVAAASSSTNVTISGSHFTPDTTVSLVSQSGVATAAAAVNFGNSNTLVATFDLTGVAPGLYNVEISDSGRTFTDPLAFQVAYPQTSVSGTIASNTQWLGGVVYDVTGNLEVQSGATLTIDPGAIVKFGPDLGLTVHQGATLVAEGTVAQPIIFTLINDDADGGNTNGQGNAVGPPPATGDRSWSTAPPRSTMPRCFTVAGPATPALPAAPFSIPAEP